MKVFFCLASIMAAMLVGMPAMSAAEDDSPAVKEVTATFEREAEAILLSSDVERAKLQAQTNDRLKMIQDRLCREAKLDEAVAVRNRIRTVEGNPPAYVSPVGAEPTLPSDAVEIADAHDRNVAELEKRTTERIVEAGKRNAAPLERLMKEYCRDAKLDEALAMRNVIQQMTSVIRDVSPDPGRLNIAETDIGKVFYFELTGDLQGSLYGTDIYTSDSRPATAAVHAGLLRVGETGVVKVTVLPGQPQYETSHRHGYTSSSYGQWSLSYKIEKARGIVKRPAGAKPVERALRQ